MKLHLNNAVVRVSGVEETRVINIIYNDVSCIEEISSHTIEKEYGEKLGKCIRIHFGDGETATFLKNQNCTTKFYNSTSCPTGTTGRK